ncbi:MAG: transposase, partial [Clostridia bacterium]|nr:transposase [Clostridia bacterium]
MSKDIAEKRLEWHNDVFVDIFNNVLFEGTEVLKEENLTSIPTQSYVRAADGTVRENDRDIRKVDK